MNERTSARTDGWLFLALFAALGGFAGLLFNLPMLTAGCLVAGLTTTTTLSQRRRQVTASVDLGLLTELAHELRSPVAAIAGFAEELDEANPFENAECIEAIKRNARFISRMVDTAFAVDSPSLSPNEILLRTLLHDFSTPLKTAAEAKGLSFTLTTASNVPQTLIFDADCWRQVVGNLVENAVKFTSSGSINLAIDYDGVCLHTRVRDTGCGIEGGYLSSIFEPFRRGASPTIEGRGLGLHVAQRIATAMQGSIDVESTPGIGSCFTFRCPVEKQVEISGCLTGRRILVADDCALQRQLIKRQLKNTNATLFEAVSGEEALAISRRVPLDTIILDLQLGGLDGLMTSQTLRQEGYKGMILGLSAHFNDAQTRLAPQKGMNELLQKPLHRTALLRVLSENHASNGSIRRAG